MSSPEEPGDGQLPARPMPQDSAEPPPPPQDSSPFEHPSMQDVAAGLGFSDPRERRPPRGH